MSPNTLSYQQLVGPSFTVSASQSSSPNSSQTSAISPLKITSKLPFLIISDPPQTPTKRQRNGAEILDNEITKRRTPIRPPLVSISGNLLVIPISTSTSKSTLKAPRKRKILAKLQPKQRPKPLQQVEDYTKAQGISPTQVTAFLVANKAEKRRISIEVVARRKKIDIKPRPLPKGLANPSPKRRKNQPI